MDVFVWGEKTAKRGADNIVSCLYIYLQRIGIIRGEGAKRLVIIADNYSGQNKNNCVFKFCCWLVDAGWAKEVKMMFLIKGHTKNECNSKLNSLKKGTFGVKMFTEKGLDAAYTKQSSDYIRLTRLPEGETRWKGFTEGLGKTYVVRVLFCISCI